VEKYRKIFLISGVYITAIVGAGFASGKEIVSYFVKYGNISILGAAAASVLFAVVLYALLIAGKNEKYEIFCNYLGGILGKSGGKVFSYATDVFMLCVLSAMLACMGNLLEHIGIVNKWGVFIGGVFCGVCLMFDLKGISCINACMSPFIVIGMIFVCVYVFFFRESSVFLNGAESIADNFAVSALEYTGYNIFTAAVIAYPLGKIIKDKDEAKGAGILSGISIFLMMAAMWCVIKIYYGKIELGDIPMLTIVLREGGGIFLTYMLVLIMSVITTAVSAGYGVYLGISRFNIRKKAAILLTCALGYAGSSIGFGNIVEYVYRACGIAGMIAVGIIIADFVKNRDKERKYKNLKE